METYIYFGVRRHQELREVHTCWSLIFSVKLGVGVISLCAASECSGNRITRRMSKDVK